MDEPIELIVEEGPRGSVSYVGFVVGETADKVALVSYIAPRKKMPPAVTISKARITERTRMVPQRKREPVAV